MLALALALSLVSADSWPASVADAEKMSRAQLAALPDVKVPLGKPLTKESFASAPIVQLKLMRNSIYAQYGVPFKTRWLRDYFETRAWYKVKTKADAAVAAVDADNAELILAREDAVGGAPHLKPAVTIDLDHIAELDAEQMKALPEYKLALGQPIDAASMKGKSLVELKLLRNSVFAQLGKGDWQTPWLKAYFESRPWYHPVAKPPAPSDVDAKNVAALKSFEYDLTPPDKRAAELLDAGECTVKSDGATEHYLFHEKGRLVLHERAEGDYPWASGESNGEWRQSDRGLEVRIEGGEWTTLVFDAKTRRCRHE